jgi:prepilin-type N-terminal cleavage/methylation domain-containing protein
MSYKSKKPLAILNMISAKAMNLPKNSKGFTLLEILVGVIIIGTLTGIAISSYFYAIDRAKRTSAISALTSIKTEMELYNMDKGSYPLGINFTNFTDQNGASILSATNLDSIKDKIYSWDSYTLGANTYTLTAEALDSKHTLLTLTPQGITY